MPSKGAWISAIPLEGLVYGESLPTSFFAIRDLRLSNCAVMRTMHTRLETLDRFRERRYGFYRARALGGIGMVLGAIAQSSDGRQEDDAPVPDDTRERQSDVIGGTGYAADSIPRVRSIARLAQII